MLASVKKFYVFLSKFHVLEDYLLPQIYSNLAGKKPKIPVILSLFLKEPTTEC